MLEATSVITSVRPDELARPPWVQLHTAHFCWAPEVAWRRRAARLCVYLGRHRAPLLLVDVQACSAQRVSFCVHRVGLQYYHEEQGAGHGEVPRPPRLRVVGIELLGSQAVKC